MVENFPGNNENVSSIKGAKIMEDFSDNNDSSIFIGQARPEDLSREEKLNELKSAAEKIAKKIALKQIELERQASGYVDEISSQVELVVEEDEDHFAGGIDGLLEKLYEFFKPLFNEFEVDMDPEIYEMLKEKKEKSRILSMLKFIQDRLKELIKKIFSRDLSFDQRLDKEIKELEEKLFGGSLSKEEEVAILERLETLRGLKLRIQMFLVGWIVTMFAEIFGVELAAAVSQETTKEEDKKAEKTSLKEENKEVREEIKVDEREKPKVPVSLFEISPGFVRPVVLSKPELDLLPKPMKELMPKEVIKEEIREIKETKPKVEEEKKAKSEEPKKEVYPPAPQQPVVEGPEKVQSAGSRTSSKKSRKINRDSFLAHNYLIGDWQEQASLGTSGKSNASADQQSSASDAQPPKELTNDVKVEKCVEGQLVGKAVRLQ